MLSPLVEAYYKRNYTIKGKKHLFNFPQSSLRAENKILDRIKLLFVLKVSLKVK